MFQLDPHSLSDRTRAAQWAPPGLGVSLLRGTLGFTLVSVAGFVPWAVFGGVFYRMFGSNKALGEIGMYIACALVFLLLSGIVLHKLIMGPGSLSRFYKVFIPAFTLYSIAWIAAWMMIGGHTGSIVGLGLGTLLMGAFFALAFESGIVWGALSVLALFALNSAGYFFGGVVEHDVAAMKEMSLFGTNFTPRQIRITAMLLWGVFYGIGLGAGLALAFYFCQARAREMCRAP